MKKPKLEPLTSAQRRNLLAAIGLQREFPEGFGYERVGERVGIQPRAAYQGVEILVRKGYLKKKVVSRNPSLTVAFDPDGNRFDIAAEHRAWQEEQARKILARSRPLLTTHHTETPEIRIARQHAQLAREMNCPDVALEIERRAGLRD